MTNEWHLACKEQRAFDSITAGELDAVFSKFYAEVRKIIIINK